MSREGAALCSAPSGRGLREARSAVLTLLDPETGGNGVRGPRWRRRRLFWFLRGAVDGLRRVPSNRQRGRLLAGPWVPAHRRRRLGPGTCRSAPVALPLAGGASGADWRLPGALRARPVTGRPQVSHPRGSTAPRPTLSHCPPRAARSVAARLPPCGCSRLAGPALSSAQGLGLGLAPPGARSLPAEGLCLSHHWKGPGGGSRSLTPGSPSVDVCAESREL